VKEQVSQADRY